MKFFLFWFLTHARKFGSYMQFPDDENRDNSENIGLFAFWTPDADGSPKIFCWIVSCLKQQILEFCCIWLYFSSLSSSSSSSSSFIFLP